MSRVLITGGAGFIASHVAEAFAEAGHEIAILDNLSSGKRENIPANLTFFEADITNREAVRRAIQEFQPEIIDHHAAHIQVGNSVKDPQFDAQNNIIGTLNILEEARQIPSFQKIIMASTGGAMYGDQEVPFRESMVAQPLSPYGISKRSGELYLHFYAVQYQKQYVVLRYSNVYGPRQNAHGESGVVAIFMEKILKGETPVINGTGENTRDYVYVKDVARANLLAFQYGKNGIFNIGTNTERSTMDVWHEVVRVMNSDISEEHGPARPGEQIRSVLDYGLAQQELGWRPEMEFSEGLRLTAESFQA